MSRFTTWHVIRNGRIIDTVFFLNECDVQSIKAGLINHDGYPVDIIVQKAL